MRKSNMVFLTTAFFFATGCAKEKMKTELEVRQEQLRVLDLEVQIAEKQKILQKIMSETEACSPTEKDVSTQFKRVEKRVEEIISSPPPTPPQKLLPLLVNYDSGRDRFLWQILERRIAYERAMNRYRNMENVFQCYRQNFSAKTTTEKEAQLRYYNCCYPANLRI